MWASMSLVADSKNGRTKYDTASTGACSVNYRRVCYRVRDCCDGGYGHGVLIMLKWFMRYLLLIGVLSILSFFGWLLYLGWWLIEGMV